MSDKRNISFFVPRCLLDQIYKRSLVNGRSRNAEVRYLLALGLEYAGENDAHVLVPTEDVIRGISRVDIEIESLIAERARQFERSLGKEMVRLMAYAIQVSTDRDLRLIKEMMQRQGQSAPAPL